MMRARIGLGRFGPAHVRALWAGCPSRSLFFFNSFFFLFFFLIRF
jgi:hypothetical protein